ncbi:MAG: hypothetical protein ABI831_06755, partial [Betaproteobacteria bacterium]
TEGDWAAKKLGAFWVARKWRAAMLNAPRKPWLTVLRRTMDCWSPAAAFVYNGASQKHNQLCDQP